MDEVKCVRCHKRIAEPSEFWALAREIRKLGSLSARYRKIWELEDSVCVCPERNTMISSIKRLANRVR